MAQIDNVNVILENGQYRDELLTFDAAGTMLEGTILARNIVTGKLVPYVKWGQFDGVGIPKTVLTYDVTAAGAGDIGVQAMVSGSVRAERLVIDSDGDGHNIDRDVLDDLRNFMLIGIDETNAPDNVSDTATLESPLRATAIPFRAKGDPTPTSARNTIATMRDFEGLNKRVLPGQIRFDGAWGVENLITKSEDMTDAAYADGNGAVSAATQTTFDGSADGEVKQAVTIVDDGSGVGNRTFVFSIMAKLISGTVSSDDAMQVILLGDAVIAVALDIGDEITATAQRFAVTASTDAAGTEVTPTIRWDDAGTLEITEWQLEEVTGQTNQAPGKYTSTGVLSAPFHGAGIDGVQYPHNAQGLPVLNGNTVTAEGVVIEAEGPVINSNTAQFAELDGVTGSNITTPDSVAASITGSITLIGYVSREWGSLGAEVVIGKYVTSPGEERSYLFQVSAGKLVLTTSEDGAALVFSTSTVAADFVSGTGGWARVSWDDAADTANYFTSDQPPSTDPSDVTWVQLGAPDIAHAGAGLFVSTSDVEIGSFTNGVSDVFTGKVYRAAVIAGTDPTVTPAVNYDANDYDTGLTQTSSATGEQWTYNGNASVFSPYSRWVDFPGSAGDFVSTPDSAAASVTDDLTLVAWVAPDDWTPGSAMDIIAKWTATGDNRSYQFILEVDGTLSLFIDPLGTGSSATKAFSTAATGFINSTGHWVRVSRNDSTGVDNFFISDNPYRTPVNKITWTQLGDADVSHAVSGGIDDNTSVVEIGSVNAGTGALFSGKIARAAVIASTDPTVAPVVDYDPRSHTSGLTWPSATGEEWTLQGNTAIEGSKNAIAPWTDITAHGYRSEGAGSNDLLQSEDYATTWTPFGAGVDVNVAVAPDGRTTADRLNIDVGGSGHAISQMITITSGGTTQLQQYIKADGGTFASLRIFSSTNNWALVTYNIVTGVVTQEDEGATAGTVNSSSVGAMGNGWYRLLANITMPADTTVNLTILGGDTGTPTPDINGDISYSGVAGADYFVWGGMMEDNVTFASTYIPTTTAPVPRDKDELTYDAAQNADYPFTASAEHVPGSPGGTRDVVSINNDSVTDRVELLTAPDKYQLFVSSGSVEQANILSASTVVTGVSAQVTGVSAIDNIELFVAGQSVGNDTSSIAPVGLTTIGIGQSSLASSQPFGNVAGIVIQPGAVPPT